jgi:hypothetical protein
VNREEQLSWEARVGRPVAIAAFLSAILLVASLVYSSSKLNQSTNDTVDGLRLIHDNKTEVLVTTVLQALSTSLLAAPLWFLYKVTRYRRAELPSLARYLALFAPIAAAVLLLIRQIQVSNVADKVVKHLTDVGGLPPNDANDYAKHQLSHGSVQIVGGLALAAGLALAFAFIIISLNAMRAGVLSRFMGIIGIIVGVLFVIPLLGQVPIVEVFWVAALGLLFLGRWPQGGRGPAWDTGEAIPWPTAQDRAAAMAEKRADREVERQEAREPVAAGGRRPAPEEEPDGDRPVTNPHPRSKKRKRKRR